MKTTREQRAAWRSSVEGRDDLPRIPPIPSDYLDMLDDFDEAQAKTEDALDLLAEVALGVTHYSGCEAAARCVRCRLEDAERKIAALDADLDEVELHAAAMLDVVDRLHAFIDTGKGDRMMLVADLNAALKPQAGGEIVARLRQAEARVAALERMFLLTTAL